VKTPHGAFALLNVLDRLSLALAGRYSLQREFGRGGMATVCLAQNLRHFDRSREAELVEPTAQAAIDRIGAGAHAPGCTARAVMPRGGRIENGPAAG
jgi:hypothetical protein